MYRVTLLLSFLLGGAVASPLLARQEPDLSISCSSDGTFALPDQCGPDYYVCVGGTAYPQTCPGGAIFDPVVLKCVLPETATCLSTTTSTTLAPTTTTRPFTCPSDGNFAIPGQCSGSYYQCIGGNPYIANCPGTTIFDPNLNRCVTNGTASCQISTTAAPTSTSTFNPTTTRASTTSTPPFTCPSDGNFAVPGQCTGNYYLCIDGVSYPTSCPGTSIFDPETLRCVANGTASCQLSTTTTVATTTWAPTTTSAPFICPGDGNYAMPGQCSGTYYVCIDGVAYKTNCPGTTIFDPEQKRCVTNGTASCQGATTATTTTMAPTTTPAPFVCPSDGNFGIPGQCSGSYYVCVDGEVYPGSCPGTTIFDPVLKRCVTNGTASCQGSTTPSVTTTTATFTTTTAATTTTPAPFVCTQDGNFPIPGQCSSNYYICIDGVRYNGMCPGLTIFDPVTLICTSPDTVSCLATTTASTATTAPSTTSPFISTTTQKPFTCGADGNYAIPGQCSNQYYLCISGNLYIQTCPGTLLFDPQTLNCVSPDTVSCRTTTAPLSTTSGWISTTTAPSSTTTAKPFTCGPDGNYAIPGQCSNQYYICVGGSAYLSTCPNNLIFDPVTLRCVSPETASCTGSSTTTTPSTTVTTTAASTTSPFISTTTQKPFTCGADGNYAIPGQCTGQYYICVGGNAYNANCPNNYIFDPVTLKCVTPETASCSGSSSTTTPSTTVTTTAASTTSPFISTTTSAPFTCGADGNYAIPGQCTGQYYICVSGSLYFGNCPGNYIFDPLTLRCVVPEAASCYGGSTTTSMTTTTMGSTTTQGPFRCPAQDGNFPIPGQCSSSYYICIDGTPYPASCPGTSIFDPNTLNCVSPDIASCRNITTTPGSSTVTSSTTSTTPTTTPTPSTTSPTTVVSSTTTASTTTPSTTTAATTTTANPGTGSTTVRPFVCPAPDGLFPNPDPNKCNSYYQCSNYNPILMFCSPPLVYNPVIGQCDWNYNVPDCKVDIDENTP